MLGYVPELRKGKSLQVTQEILNTGDTEDAKFEEKVNKKGESNYMVLVYFTETW